MQCHACLAPAPDGARFCPACGQDLRLRGDERRVVTVLFADLVGFTSLSEARDPEQVKRIIDHCFERLVADVEAFGGRVDKIIGDAVVALFGAPVAHEDDAERAVRAALRMHDTLAGAAPGGGVEVKMRVGVNTGEVLVGALRAGGDYTAMGDVVNTANRLQSTAQPGQVVVGPATYGATRRVIRYRALGPVHARGRDEPVPAWVAEAVLAPPGYRPDRGRAPLVGRDAELGLLRQTARTAFAGHRAALVLLSGEAGVGKSRLAEEVAAGAAADDDALVLEGRCVPYGEANVWWPVAEALRQGCGIRAEDPEDVARELALVAVRSALGADGSPAGAPSDEVGRVLNGLLHLMGYDTALRRVEAARARDEATAAVLTLVERFSLRRPVVVALSDLHWADDLVLDLLDTLLERLAGRPFLVMATARGALDDRWRPRQGRHHLLRVVLDPLAPDAAAALLHELASGLPPELADDLLDRAGGNPFFLEELVALLAEAGMVGAAPTGAPRTSAPIELPDTLRGLVAARLDGLGPDERAVLDDCAVLGRRGLMKAIQVMATEHLGIADARPVIEALVAKDLLELTGHGETERWGFRSDLVREVAYGTLTKAVRARTHAGIAHWMEAHQSPEHEAAVDQITHHYVRAAELVADLGPVEGVPHDLIDRALAWVVRAAGRAAEAEMSIVAVRLHDSALRLLDAAGAPPDDVRRRRFLLRRAAARAALRELAAARADAEGARNAARDAGDHHTEARALLMLADIEQKDDDWRRADELLDEAEARFAALGDPSGVAEVLRTRGFGALFRHEIDRAEELLVRARDRFREAGDRRGAAWAIQNLGWCAFYSGRLDEAERRLAEAMSSFGELGDVGGQMWAQGLRAWTRHFQGHSEEAEAMAEPLVEELRLRGDRWAYGMMLVLTATIRLWTGRLAASSDRARAAVAHFERIGDAFGLVQAQVVHGRALISSGAVAEGLGVLDEAFEQLRGREGPRDRFVLVTSAVGAGVQLGDVAYTARRIDGLPRPSAEAELAGEGELLVLLGRHRLQRGDVAGSAQELEALAARSDAIAPGLGAALALTRAACGQTAEAVATADAVLGDRLASYLDRIDALVARGVAGVRDGDADGGLSDLDAARQAAEQAGDQVAAAVARLAAAVATHAAGREEAAARRSDAAASLDALGIGAEGWHTALAVALGTEPALSA